MKPRVLFLVVSALGIATLCILFLAAKLRMQNDVQPFAHGATADVSWQMSGQPMEIVCKVVDTNNQPISNVSLNFINNSGGNRAVTDQLGGARLSVGEREIERIVVNEHPVLERPRAYSLNYPTVQSGLVVKIVIKDPKILEKVGTLDK